jgi:hypothetical protein
MLVDLKETYFKDKGIYLQTNMNLKAYLKMVKKSVEYSNGLKKHRLYKDLRIEEVSIKINNSQEKVYKKTFRNIINTNRKILRNIL